MEQWDSLQIFLLTHHGMEREEFLEIYQNPVFIEEGGQGIPVADLLKVKEAFEGVVRMDALNLDSLPGSSQKKKKDKFKFIEFPEGQSEVFVGTQINCAIQFKHNWIERRHTRIEKYLDDFYKIMDLNSRTGTMLNGTKMMPGVEYPLVNFCRVIFGKSREYLFFTPSGLFEYMHILQESPPATS